MTAPAMRSSCLPRAAFWLLVLSSIFYLLSSISTPAAQMRFGPYTNYDGTLITNITILVKPVGEPALDAAGNAASMHGLVTRVTLGADGMATNWLQNDNYQVTNQLGGPIYFSKGYLFRAPLDSGPTVYSTTAPGILLSGMDYFVTQVITNGTTASITFNVITNALGFTPLAANQLPGLTNGFVRADITNQSATIAYAQSLTNGFVRADITNQSATIAFAESLTNGFVDKSITNNAATRAELISATNGLAANAINALTATNINNASGGVIATNGTALTYKFSTAGTNAILAIAAPLTNGFVDQSITNNAATKSYAQSLTNGFVDQSITNNAATRAELISATNGLAANAINALTATNINNASGGVIATNGASLTYKFSSAGTNAILAIAEPLTNGFVDKSITNNAATKVYAQSLTNGFVDQSITNNAATISLLNTASNLLQAQKINATNGFSTNQMISGTMVVGPSVWLSTNQSPPTPVFRDYDPINGDVVQLTHGGAEFFWGITNGLSQSFIDFNIDGESEYNVRGSSLGSIAHRFYLTLNGHPDTNYFEITYAGVRAPIASAPFIGNGSGVTNIAASGVSTNGSTSGQILTSLNGQAVWTNATPASTAITNAYGTNRSTVLVANQSIYIPTNFDGAGGSNFLQIEKINATNGFATGSTLTNLTIQGDVNMGRDGGSLVFLGRTNYIAFTNAGSGIMTNGAFVWVSGLNEYTNYFNGAVLTNNGTQWLAVSNGTTLYSLSGSSPIGTYLQSSGVLPNPTGVYTEAANDHLVMLGYWSKTNQDQLFYNATNGANITASNNFVVNSNGFATNTFITNAVLSWAGAPAVNFVDNGGSVNFGALAAGMRNQTLLSGFGAAILSGSSNLISADGAALIAGGTSNVIFGGSGNADAILSGAYNKLIGSAGISSVDANVIAGGMSNSVNTVSIFSSISGGYLNANNSAGYSSIIGGLGNTNLQTGAVILGGNTNRNKGLWSVAAGRNVTITNDNVFDWSDGIPDTSATNSQFRITATNGLALNGPLWLGAANTNAGVYYLSNSTPFSLYAVTNSMPNFAFWQGQSNGILVTIYLSNGVPFMKNNWP